MAGEGTDLPFIVKFAFVAPEFIFKRIASRIELRKDLVGACRDIGYPKSAPPLPQAGSLPQGLK